MNKTGRHLDRYRSKHPTLGKSEKGARYGYFQIPTREKVILHVISSGEKTDSKGVNSWEHVSVSLPDRCPTWDEMCLVKRLFFKPIETVVQFHPPESEYVNTHPFCLHLWRHESINTPPTHAV